MSTVSEMRVDGIHHVTGIAKSISMNLRFYTKVLGMRLVKKSINQDDVTAYHLFYADAVGSAGTDLTFFDWPKVVRNQPGAGSISLTTLRAWASSFEFWQQRLEEEGCFLGRDQDLGGRERLLFTDFEGQRLAMIDDEGLAGTVIPWRQEIPASHGMKGIYGVNLESTRPDETKRVLVDVLGYADVDGNRFQVNTDHSASEVVVTGPLSGAAGMLGAGGMHHVAFRVPDDETLLAFRDKIEAAGFRTSGYVDRYYFHSLYFREPGGVLFELATDGPGMHSDEPLESLGEKLSIPPFLEHRRAEIEANLKPIG